MNLKAKIIETRLNGTEYVTDIEWSDADHKAITNEGNKVVKDCINWYVGIVDDYTDNTVHPSKAQIDKAVAGKLDWLTTNVLDEPGVGISLGVEG